jgi:hypothetical protein
MINELGEDRTKTILSEFSCPVNLDVESFIHHKAIDFSKQGLSGTHLVSTSHKKKDRIIGYFTLAIKLFHVSGNKLSKNWIKRISKFGTYDSNLKKYSIPAPLIGQLSKNYNDSLNMLITGDELLKMALEKISVIHMITGGRVVFLECQNVDRLIEFYDRNGFVEFGERKLDQDEVSSIPGESLIQMLMYQR